MFIHQNSEWYKFYWDETIINQLLNDIKFKQGFLLGKMNELGFAVQTETSLKMLSLDILKSSEIEGENLKLEHVRSSVAKKLGLDTFVTTENIDDDTQGIVDLMVDATQHYNKPITKSRLFRWHNLLFNNSGDSLYKIIVGKWRNDKHGPMQVVSGRIGREKVHFQAPKAKLVPSEMKLLIKWLNDTNNNDNVLNSAIAHLWFVTIHPFEDGNGRIARAISDLFLARSEQSSKRFYSMSNQINNDRNNYYNILEQTQKSNSDITEWLRWFLQSLATAIDDAENICNKSLAKSRFWNVHNNLIVSSRQKKIINKLFDGFTGNLTTTKWAKICKCSQDTAYRDILDLMDKGILEKSNTQGRSTHYKLVEKK